ncbi:hypothetical protein GCM10010532_015440 [Dactylosporangium siamense]|uniref:Uncharacterized protein n=1 Tax=Dactylosporangium siamense TaxID=685454 RepID=A0A919U7U0_9ACTN|nr:hypothetical protein Dsi01nite_000960 [Dactylosporangium siamense]
MERPGNARTAAPGRHRERGPRAVETASASRHPTDDVSSSPRLDDRPEPPVLRRRSGDPTNPRRSVRIVRPATFGAAPRRHPTRLESALRKGSFPLARPRVNT